MDAFSDDTTPLARLKELVRAFSVERDWEQFHHPKDLGVALACEVGELLEHFRYRRDDEIRAWLDDPRNRRLVADEVADCLWLVLRLADVVGFDLASALAAKGGGGGAEVSGRAVAGAGGQVHGLSRTTRASRANSPVAERAAPGIEAGGDWAGTHSPLWAVWQVLQVVPSFLAAALALAASSASAASLRSLALARYALESLA